MRRPGSRASAMHPPAEVKQHVATREEGFEMGTEPSELAITAIAYAVIPIGKRDFRAVKIQIVDGKVSSMERIGIADYPYFQVAYERAASKIRDDMQTSTGEPERPTTTGEQA